jgi:hypothetical protein
MGLRQRAPAGLEHNVWGNGPRAAPWAVVARPFGAQIPDYLIQEGMTSNVRQNTIRFSVNI